MERYQPYDDEIMPIVLLRILLPHFLSIYEPNIDSPEISWRSVYVRQRS